jgi:glyoxylase-like metal-dependent hydrolase (beta-lactamase superfamily II)
MNIELIRMNPQNTNSVLVHDGVNAVIFDAWGDARDWEKLLGDKNLTLKSIYATHGHYDHTSQIAGEWHLHRDDIPFVEWDIKPLHIEQGEIEILPGIKMTAIHTPGHSKGGMGFLITPTQVSVSDKSPTDTIPPPQTGAGKTVFISGDTLFRDSVGRWDLPGGDEKTLMQSIQKIRDMNLPDDTVVIPGHGPIATIGEIKSENLFFRRLL